MDLYIKDEFSFLSTTEGHKPLFETFGLTILQPNVDTGVLAKVSVSI